MPTVLSSEIFWKRYFFRVQQVSQEEQRRKALLQGAFMWLSHLGVVNEVSVQKRVTTRKILIGKAMMRKLHRQQQSQPKNLSSPLSFSSRSRLFQTTNRLPFLPRQLAAHDALQAKTVATTSFRPRSATTARPRMAMRRLRRTRRTRRLSGRRRETTMRTVTGSKTLG